MFMGMFLWILFLLLIKGIGSLGVLRCVLGFFGDEFSGAD